MSFEAYLQNIEIKQAKTSTTLRSLQKKNFLERGILREGVKAGEIVAWLKEDFRLGHGHSMAIFAALKGKKE